MMCAARMILSVVLSLVLSVSMAVAAEDFTRSGFLGNPSVYDMLRPLEGGGARWLKPGVDFKKYNKFMVDSVIFFLADNSDYKGIDPQEMKELCDEFNKALVAAFKDKLPIVAEPGPDVARVRFAITNVQPSRPGVSAVTSVIPVGLGVSLVKKGATGGWVGSGETAAELMVLDTATNEIVALGAIKRAAEFDERFSKWGSARETFKFWSEKLVQTLTDVR
ncbi:DUF3313 domain-containing protein, partial [bacterium]|nr:DUF3313 domain-containing protein [bacterium]